jgi:transcription-repair coupling factor (superfamily II helicase)
LAQLYQLRGRVGRGAQRAYTYFFRHPRRQPTVEGRQRLETIAENTSLGAGFSIAMRDLEIRGAGDLLGTRQHGHIAAVGFNLYTRLLADAVRRLSGKSDLPLVSPATLGAVQIALPVNVDLPVPSGIPASYVPDKNMRLRLYRRIAEIRSQTEVQALNEEFKDRFGPLPVELENLLFQLTIKLKAEKAGLASISNDNGQLVFRFPEQEVPSNLPNIGPNVRVGKTALWMPYKKLDDWRATLVEVLDILQNHLQRPATTVKSYTEQPQQAG